MTTNPFTLTVTTALERLAVAEVQGNWREMSAVLRGIINGDISLFALGREALAATGSSASDAAVITKQVTAVTASNGTKGVALPAADTASGPILVINTVATSTLKVYPVSGGNDNINGLAEDAAFVMGPGEAAWFIPTSATQWYVRDKASLASTVTELAKATDVSAAYQELTASGAVTATQLLELNHVSTVIAATVADATALAGLFCIKNTSASGTAAHTVTLTGGTFDGTNNIATLDAPGELLLVFFETDGTGHVLLNTGSVGLSS